APGAKRSTSTCRRPTRGPGRAGERKGTPPNCEIPKPGSSPVQYWGGARGCRGRRVSKAIPDVVRDLGGAARLQAALTLSDAQLLEQFARQRDEAAFEALLHRHGPLVFGVCRRMLFDVQDAEDAFQAAFLVLARKASSITRRSLLSNWLYGVAFR